MIIYIYGNDSFKKEIHDSLNHSNIKFRLDEDGEIIDLNTVDELKNAIEENPNNIYLIDDSKIIKKNALHEKIKFLKPKNGIEQEYLLDHGIGDVSVDSIEELSKHIIKKLEKLEINKDSENIQESIVEMVEEAYENEDDQDAEDIVQLDDELKALLSSASSNSDDENDLLNNVEVIDEIKLPEENNEDFSKQNDTENLSFDQDLDTITEIDMDFFEKLNNEEITDITEPIIDNSPQGEKMADTFSEFDTLSENDILAALEDLDNVTITKESNEKENSSQITTSPKNENSQSIELNSSDNSDIAKLITQLLNNKTLEITIKVKD